MQRWHCSLTHSPWINYKLEYNNRITKLMYRPGLQIARKKVRRATVTTGGAWESGEQCFWIQAD